MSLKFNQITLSHIADVGTHYKLSGSDQLKKSKRVHFLNNLFRNCLSPSACNCWARELLNATWISAVTAFEFNFVKLLVL